MPFVFHHDAHRLDLEDLTLDEWIVIQEATGFNWPDVLSAKVLGDAKVAQVVIGQCAKHLGIEPPKTLTLRTLVELIKYEVPENLPQQFEDGIPDPKASDSEQATT